MRQFVTIVLKTVELLMLILFFGLAPVVAIFLSTAVVGSIVLGKESLGPWVLWSLMPGVLIDVIFLKRWVRNAYTVSAKVIGVLYVFYSVCAIGFFMGVPIGNIVLGILAGVCAGRRVSVTGNNRINSRSYFRRVAIFSSAVMVLICSLITLWAIAGKMIGYEVEFPLSFTLTAPIFWSVVVTGGAFLVLLKYWLTRTAAKVTYNLSN